MVVELCGRESGRGDWPPRELLSYANTAVQDLAIRVAVNGLVESEQFHFLAPEFCPPRCGMCDGRCVGGALSEGGGLYDVF